MLTLKMSLAWHDRTCIQSTSTHFELNSSIVECNKLFQLFTIIIQACSQCWTAHNPLKNPLHSREWSINAINEVLIKNFKESASRDLNVARLSVQWKEINIFGKKVQGKAFASKSFCIYKALSFK